MTHAGPSRKAIRARARRRIVIRTIHALERTWDPRGDATPYR